LIIGFLLRFHIKRKLKRLDYDFKQFNIESFVACVEKDRVRRIEFVPTAFPAGYDGAWITDKDEPVDYVCYEQSLSPLHQAHVKLHELGHIICEHETLALGHREMQRLLENQGDLPSVLCRSNELKSNRNEREAEMVATVIQTMVYGRTGPVKPDSSSPTGKSYLSIFCDRD
jgi:hypothetical protein